jgi:hypothetical protein
MWIQEMFALCRKSLVTLINLYDFLKVSPLISEILNYVKRYKFNVYKIFLGQCRLHSLERTCHVG